MARRGNGQGIAEADRFHANTKGGNFWGPKRQCPFISPDTSAFRTLCCRWDYVAVVWACGGRGRCDGMPRCHLMGLERQERWGVADYSGSRPNPSPTEWISWGKANPVCL